MTNTKFRKRALLSSVAMLLVALVALGSATFAWFTQDLTASASGLKLNTSTSAGLVALSASEKTYYDSLAESSRPADYFSHNTILNCSTTAHEASSTQVPLQPASFCGTDINTTSTTAGEKGKITFYSTSATAVDSYAGGTAYGEQTAIRDEIVYLRTTADSSGAAITETIHVTGVTVTIDETSVASILKGAVRVAITDSTGKLVGVWKAPSANKGTRSAETHVNSTHDNVVTCAAASGGDGNYVMTASGTGVTLTDTNRITVTNSGTDNYVHVIVYLDGEDENCKSNQVTNGADLTAGISVSFVAS